MTYFTNIRVGSLLGSDLRVGEVAPLAAYYGDEQVFEYDPSVEFFNGEAGAFYQIRPEYLFQNAAGTTPVTEPGQPVGFVTDRSGSGNHATQTTAQSRPTYGIVPVGGRRNLMLRTEEFNISPWVNVPGGTGVAPVLTANAGVAPDGTATADRIVLNKGEGNTLTDCSLRLQNTNLSGTHTRSVWMRSFDGSSEYVVTIEASDFNNPASAVVVTGEWQRFVYTTTSNVNVEVGLRGGYVTTNSNTADILVWGYQIEEGSEATSYQRVGNAFDVTEAGVRTLHYLNFDGVDDTLAAGAPSDWRFLHDGSAQAVFAGVEIFGDGNLWHIVATNTAGNSNATGFDLSPDYRSSDSRLFHRITNGSGTLYYERSFGNIGQKFDPLVIASTAHPFSLRWDGNETTPSTTNGDPATGNPTRTLYIGSRQTDQFLPAKMFGLCIVGANLTANEIARTERWMARETGVTL